MTNPELYTFGPDGTLWTCINGVDRRPSTVEEREGFCLQRRPAAAPAAPPPQSALEPPELPIAV